jgi:hypothetical protein
MNIKKLLAGGIAGGTVSFFAGWVIYGMLLMDFAAKHSIQNVSKPDDQMIYWALIAGNIGFGLLYAYIFQRANVNTVGDGLITGIITGVLMACGWDLVMFATSNIADLVLTLTDVAVSGIMGGLSGAVIGFVNSKMSD